MTAFFRKLFGARGAPAGDQPGDQPGNQPDLGGGSTEDWQPGDIAECIHGGPWYKGAIGPGNYNGPKKGQRLRVRAVGFFSDWRLPPSEMLVFGEFQPLRFCASAFRKVRPHADEAIAADAAFVRTIRQAPQSPPAPAPAPARELEEAAFRGRRA